MLSFVSRFGSYKGMVPVPNLNGLNRSQAIAAIQTAGLTFKSNSPVESSNSSLNDKVSSQEIPSGTLVDYESEISFSYYIYVAPAVVITVGNCADKPNSTTTSVTCTNYGQNNTETTTTTTERQALIFANGVSTGTYQACQASVTTSTKSQTAFCGYIAPARTCVASETWDGPWSACQEIFGVGTKVRYKTYVYTNCSSETKKFEEACCSAGLVSCTKWVAVPGGETRTCTYRNVDCSTYTTNPIRCTVTTKTNCTSCTKTTPFRKTCTTTTTNSDCSQTSKSSTVNC
jgi:hypothetical protein